MFRILALDGGGVRGLFAAAVLAELERNLGRPVAEHFDLIVGTSTGAILALGLGFGMSAVDVEALYLAHGNKIFPTSLIPRQFSRGRGLFLPKYSRKPLKEALSALAGKSLGDSKSRLVIPTFDAQKGHACTFKTPHHPRSWQDQDLPALDIAVAAAAAPTYFGAARVTGRPGALYIDGGVWANTPTMVGIVEALAYCDAHIEDIALLSIGTTGSLLDVAQRERAGLLGWRWRILDPVFAGQSTGVLHQARILLGPERFERIDHSLRDGPALDDARTHKLDQLLALAHGIARANDLTDRVAKNFLNGKAAAPFVRHPRPSGRQSS